MLLLVYINTMYFMCMFLCSFYKIFFIFITIKDVYDKKV